MRAITKSALLAGVLSLSFTVQAFAEGPVYYPGFKPTTNSIGQPDISGAWAYTTMTPFERSPTYGDRMVMTKEEAAKMEGTRAEQNKISDKPTSVDATVKDLGKDCSGGRGENCNYNGAWTDPGDRVMRVGGVPHTSIVTTPDGRIPANLQGVRPTRVVEGEEAGAGTAQPGSAAVRADPPGRNDNPEGRSLGERCVNMSNPVPRSGLYNNNYAIQQSRDAVLMWSEMNHELKIVRLNGQHRTDGIRTWSGDAIGHFEGNTLVVETTNFDPRVNFYNASDALKVTERFTRVSPTRLYYQFTVDDPKTWAKPWGGEYEFNTSQGIFEYACAEGNYGLEAILAGARNDEAIAAGKGATTARAQR
jgi:hypothetical protein